MSRQLDILALEPFYGGARRAMLETVIRCSRHRWTLLKLPPRRMERRLTAAANWFAEQLTRHWAGRMDLLFTSEAMNLANLYRMMPALGKSPSVVYFHHNQLPLPDTIGNALDLVNLNTAAAATEIWFNSLYHLRTFLERASALVERHSELSSRNPMAQLASKAHLMQTPIDISSILELRALDHVVRDPRTIFIETRDADAGLLNEALRRVAARGQDFKLVTVGPVETLSDAWERKTISEVDDAGQIAGLLESGIFLSVKPDAVFDYQAIRAVAAGCLPLLPRGGCYPELLPESSGASTLYEVDPDSLAQRLYLAMRAPSPPSPESELRRTFKPFESLAACRVFDERLEVLADFGAPGM